MTMKVFSLLALLCLSCLVGAVDLRPRDYDANDYYVLHLDSNVAPETVAQRLGLTHEGQLGELEDHYIFAAPKQEEDIVKGAIKARRALRKRGSEQWDALDAVKLAQKQKVKPRHEKRVVLPDRRRRRITLDGRTDTQTGWQTIQPAVGAEHAPRPILDRQADPAALLHQQEIASKLQIADPIFKEQWHLYNTIDREHDVNVTDVWVAGITGFNSTVAIVDDGLDMYSMDLKDNYFAEGSYDFNENQPEPKPILADDNHGTRCAGEVAAGRNAYCGIGVAYDAKVAGIRILSKLISDADEAIAMNYAYQKNQIYSCSWGPLDNGRAMDAPGVLIRRAMLNAVQKGRGGKGSIYVFASGNGAASEDNCNFDGYTNSIYSITIGALDRKGKHPYYSEQCSAQMVVTYSSGSGDAIHTTDVGENSCTTTHGGTSAAAPLAAGIFALVLQVRPDLSWRDMQALAMETAVKVEEATDWQTTPIGKQFSHTFGYGKIDTWAIVEAAKTFKTLKPQAWFYSPWIKANKAIPQGDKGLVMKYDVTAEMLKRANLEKVEHVTVTMNLEHQFRGDVSVDLISPNGIVSHLATRRSLDDSTYGFRDWTFMSVAHWGESGIGAWTLTVRDTAVNEHVGNLTDFHLKLWGESIDPKKAFDLPLPNENDDDDHDANGAPLPSHATSLAPATSSMKPVQTSSVAAVPSDNPTRPVPPKIKPSTTAAEASATASSSAAPAVTGAPEGSTWLSWLPSFGFGPKTTAWLWGVVALIAAFGIGLGGYFWWAKRKQAKDQRDSYEFEVLRDEEEGPLVGGAKGKRRAGELYDAFATGSDDEDDEAGGYRDREMDERRRDDDVEGCGSGSASGSGSGEIVSAPRKDSLDHEHHVLGGDSDEESDNGTRGGK